MTIYGGTGARLQAFRCGGYLPTAFVRGPWTIALRAYLSYGV
jgi:hypothetical protein